MKKRKKWRMKDGTEIEIKDMEDSHLLNAYKMLKRKGFIGVETLKFYLTCTPPTADIASYYFEQEQDMVFQSPVSEFVDYFEDEIKKRNLKE